jgi:hypothetical protein
VRCRYDAKQPLTPEEAMMMFLTAASGCLVFYSSWMQDSKQLIVATMYELCSDKIASWLQIIYAG